MMGPRQVEHGALFYNFSIETHVPADHLLRSIDRFIDLSELRRELAPFYSTLGRPTIDPERSWQIVPDVTSRLLEDELRALRTLKRAAKSVFIFVSGCNVHRLWAGQTD
jgi:hypothetical protein